MKWVTANDIAGDDVGAQKAFRQALRDDDPPWHTRYARWKVPYGGEEHKHMQRIYEKWRKQSS